ncbi:unnamed protein product [Calypogeia fissa]
MLNLCYEPMSRTEDDSPVDGSLPRTFQLPHVKKASAIGEYLENELKFRHGVRKELLGLTNSSQASRDTPTSTPLLQASKESCNEYGTTTAALSRESRSIYMGKSFKDHEVSCDVPSYWTHWFGGNDFKFLNDTVNYALALTQKKEENGLSTAANNSETSVRNLHKQEDIVNQVESGKYITYGDNESSVSGNDGHKDKFRKCEMLVEGSCQATGRFFIRDGNQFSNFKLGSKAIASMEAQAAKSRLKNETCLVNYRHVQSVPLRSSDISSDKDEAQRLGMERVDETSKSSSMKSTKSTLSSLQGENQSSATFYDLDEDCSASVLEACPLSGFEHRDRNAVDVNLSMEGRSRSGYAFANHLQSLASKVDLDEKRPCWESRLSYTGGASEKSHAHFEDGADFTSVSGEIICPEDKSPTGKSDQITVPRFHGLYGSKTVIPEKAHGALSSRRNLVPSSSTVFQSRHRRKSVEDNAEADEQPTLSLSCMDRLQACVENVLRYKRNKGSISRPTRQGHFLEEGGDGLARILDDGEPSHDELNCQNSEDGQYLKAKAVGAPSNSIQNTQKTDAQEYKTRRSSSHSSGQDSNCSREAAARSTQPTLEEVCTGSNTLDENEDLQLMLTSNDFDRNQGSLVNPRSPSRLSKARFGIDTKGKHLEDAAGAPMASYTKNNCNNAEQTNNTREKTFVGDQCAPSSSSSEAVAKPCETTDLRSSEDVCSPIVTNEGIIFGSPHLESVCDQICSSFTQSRKSIEEVLGACADVVVTSLLPTISLDEELSCDTKGCCDCRDTPDTVTDPHSGHSLHPPCLPSGLTPGRPLPRPVPTPPLTPPRLPPPPPPPPPPPRSVATSPPTLPILPRSPVTPVLQTSIQATPLTSSSTKTPPPPPPPPNAPPVPPKAPLPPLKKPAPPPPPPPNAPPVPPKAPPPPLIKPAPPPPPPPGGRKDLSSMQAKRPKMKQLVWDKITGSMADLTIWKTATPDEIKMDLVELEALFAVKDAASHQKPPVKVVSVGKKTQGVQVLDLKRAHNIGIQLRSLRKPIPELCQALREKDEATLTMEVLNVMFNTLPSEEDVALLQGYQGDPSELAEVEMYYMELLKIPRREKLIKSFIFKGQYHLTFQQIEQELKVLEQACNQLKGSQSFKKILETVLVVGNHLNGDSFRGAARGFKLGALLKLMDVKSHNNKTTLLHFVVAELMRTDEKVLKLTEVSRAVKAAANLSLERMQSGLRELENGLDLIKAEISVVTEASHDDQQLVILMMPFYEKVNSEVMGLTDLHNTTMANLKDLAIYFGETLKQERLIDLFKTMREFFFMFDQVTLELKEARRREVETASKKSQSNPSFSCPASPAHKAFRGGQRTSEPFCNVEVSKEVILAPDRRSKAEQTSLDILPSSLLCDRNSSSASLCQSNGPRYSNKLDQEEASSSQSVVDDQQYLQGGGQNSCGTVTTLDLGDRFTERLDPLSSQSTCYDSDWSTG